LGAFLGAAPRRFDAGASCAKLRFNAAIRSMTLIRQLADCAMAPNRPKLLRWGQNRRVWRFTRRVSNPRLRHGRRSPTPMAAVGSVQWQEKRAKRRAADLARAQAEDKIWAERAAAAEEDRKREAQRAAAAAILAARRPFQRFCILPRARSGARLFFKYGRVVDLTNGGIGSLLVLRIRRLAPAIVPAV
jgi:hypothetical protein